MIRRSRYDAALNRVRRGSAPKFGTAGAAFIAAIEEQPDRNIWWRWRAHSSLASVVRKSRPRER